jgi:hypothetical protein
VSIQKAVKKRSKKANKAENTRETSLKRRDNKAQTGTIIAKAAADCGLAIKAR